ncbi:MAG: hypothetical protein B6226_04780 [Candidatus Cloacimonetes bacterium 4572_65]|nr:MAG: hypothetical protein B6226_04780 [Candidatus Cloacimonetes bacterium 4572_65]
MNNINTLVLDEMPTKFWELIKESGEEHLLTQDNLLFSEDIEVIILRTKSTITESHYKRFPNLKTVIRAGSGYDNIDVDNAPKYDVVIQNTPDANVQSAFEHTINLILAHIKQNKIMNSRVLNNRWKTDLKFNLEISDIKLLVVGLGRIGSKVADFFSTLGAEVKFVDPYIDASPWREKDIYDCDFSTGVEWCNVLTYHTPLYPDTYHHFSNEVLTNLSKPIYLFNVARGGIVDIDAVKKGLESGKIIGAGVDVFENEPWQYEGWEDLENLTLTPHVGAYTVKARERISVDCFTAWKDYCNNKEYRYPVKVWK